MTVYGTSGGASPRNELTANDALQATSCKGMQMLNELGVGYQPKTALQSVRTFQNAWNGILDSVRTQPGIILPSRNRGMLVVDGLYGAQSAAAVNNFIKIAVPLRAADVPPWAAKSEDALMAMCPPAPPLEPIPAPITAATIVEAKAPPPIQQYLAPPPVVMPPAPIPMGTDSITHQPAAPAPPPQVIPVAAVVPTAPVVKPLEPIVIVPMPSVPSSGPVVVQSPSAPALLPAAPGMTLMPTQRVLAPKSQGYGPLAALGLGVLAVGGVLTFWMVRKR